MNQKIILQVDGGGILGITPAIVLAELEKRLRIKTNNATLLIRDKLDLCCGTSTGAIWNDKINLYRLDYEAKDEYSLDDTSHVAEYKQGATDIINSPVFNNMVSAIL